ncbi:MAG: hypothetical protein IJU50_08330, partial [Lachnospiraceae bacterium]|nr:hypothetical protein [Lachnospiraceae bacterium]
TISISGELARVDDLLKLRDILNDAESAGEAGNRLEDALSDQYASYDKKTKTYTPGASILTNLKAFREAREDLAAGEQPDFEALQKELAKQMGFLSDDLKNAKESDLMKEADSWFSSATKEEKHFLKGLKAAMSQTLKVGVNKSLKKSIDENDERGDSKEAHKRQEARIKNALIQSEIASFNREWQKDLDAREEKAKPALAAYEKERSEKEKARLKQGAKAREDARKEQEGKAVSRFLSWKNGSSPKEQELPGAIAFAFVMSKGTYTASKFKRITDAFSESQLEEPLQKDIKNAMLVSEDVIALKNSMEKADSVEEALNSLKAYFDKYRAYDAKADAIIEEQSPLEQAEKLLGKGFAGMSRFFTRLRKDIANGSSADLDGLDDLIGSFLQSANGQMEFMGEHDAIRKTDVGKRMRAASKLKTVVKHSFRYQDDQEAKEGAFITEEKQKEQKDIAGLKQKAYEEFDQEWKVSKEALAEEIAQSRDADLKKEYEKALRELEEDERKTEEKAEELKKEEGVLDELFQKFSDSPSEAAEEVMDGLEDALKYVDEFQEKYEEGDLTGFVKELRLPDAVKKRMDEYLAGLYGEAKKQEKEYAKEKEEEDEGEEEEKQTLEDYVKEKAAEKAGLSFEDGTYSKELYGNEEEGEKTKEKGYSVLFGQLARSKTTVVKGRSESSFKAGLNEDWELSLSGERSAERSSSKEKSENENMVRTDTIVKGAEELSADAVIDLAKFKIQGNAHAKYQGFERNVSAEIKEGLFKGGKLSVQYSALGAEANLEFAGNKKKFYLKAEAQAHLAKGEVSAKFLNHEISLSGEILSAEAKAKAKADYRKRKLKAKAELSANLVKGEAKAAFNLMGVKIMASGEAGIGVGGSAELKMNRKKIKAAAALAFGLEVGGNFEIDLSQIEDAETLDLVRSVVSGTLDAFERTSDVKESVIQGRIGRAKTMNHSLRRMGLI